jgi:hypothetical protein
MISSYELKHKFKYDWIVRTRVHGYGNGPLPPLETLNPKYYYVPFGSRFGGLNDRLGIGSRRTSLVALSRLSSIPKLYINGYRFLNSEQALMRQLEVSHVKYKFDDFRFCVLTARRYSWPLKQWDVPVASIKSKGALNGAKCKPCQPVLTGEAARQAIEGLNPGWGWTNPVEDTGWGWLNPAKDVQLCGSSLDLDPDWEYIFDDASGLEAASNLKWITNRPEEQCIDELHQFMQLWEIWDGPGAETICRRGAKFNTTEVDSL